MSSARRRRSPRSSAGGALVILAIFVALIAVLLWEIGCSRQTAPSGGSSTQTAMAPRVHKHNRHQVQPAEQPVAETQKPQEPAAARSASEAPQPSKVGEDGQSPSLAPNAEPPAPTGTDHLAPTPPQEAPKGMRHGGGVLARVIVNGNPGRRRVALTFDAGASGAPTPKILTTLARHNLHVTFFLTGKWVEQNPDLVRRIASAGHEIGNHSYNHPRFTSLSDSRIAEQLEQTESLVLAATGRSTKPYFRPPFGCYSKHVLQELPKYGYTDMIYWSLDCWDSVVKGITSTQIKDRVLRKIKDGDIVLMHCGSQPTADALDDIINALGAKGYSVVTVGELIGR